MRVAYLFTPGPRCTIINIFYKYLGSPHIHFWNGIPNKYLITFILYIFSIYSLHITVICLPTKVPNTKKTKHKWFCKFNLPRRIVLHNCTKQIAVQFRVFFYKVRHFIPQYINNNDHIFLRKIQIFKYFQTKHYYVDPIDVHPSIKIIWHL